MTLDPSSRYTRNYCEENVWHLCGDCEAAGIEACAVVVSNTLRRVAVWRQRRAAHPLLPVVWDYHVFLLARVDARWRVYDADSSLPPGSAAGAFIDESFPRLPRALVRLAPRFRVVDAAVYRARLATDRSHMRRRDGRWRSPPPAWPPIGEGTNLMRFVEMRAEFLGEVVDRTALRARFGD